MNKIQFIGKQLVNIPMEKKKYIAKQVIAFLKLHKKHMVQFSETQLIEYMNKGLTVLLITNQYELLGFAKLYPWIVKNKIKGYEFSSWISKIPNNGIGKQIVNLICDLHKQLNPGSDLFAIISSDNINPISTLKKLGAIEILIPSYVKNLLKGKPETCINLKTITNYYQESMNSNKIYGGIYTKGPSKKTDQFIMDPTMTVLENKLVPYYLWETIAHNLMIAKQGIVPKKISKKILKELLKLVEKAEVQQLVDPLIGDVHENIESQLTKTVGDDAGWFHIGRSRNDQSVVDQKLFTKKFLLDFFEKLSHLELILLKKTEQNKEVIMPGFTHLRSAMPSTFGFWWQAYLDQIINLHLSLKFVYQITDKSPLGAGASYGVNWKIDPEFTAKKLGFSKPLNNALSSINARGIDDALIISNLTVFLTILSRMMEDLIIWSMPELNFVAISEEFTTGSSIMPQKMNPDIAEKVKSKSAKLIGNLNHVLVAMKGTPSGYNRDSAESKIAIISSLEESFNTVSITCDMLDKIIPNPEMMKKATISSLPTKLADKLVEEYNIPFRLSHKVIGKIICLIKGDFTKINPLLMEMVIKEITGKNFPVNQKLINDTLNIENALNQYDYQGSPKPYFVFQVNNLLEKEVNQLSQWGKKEKKKFSQAKKDLYQEVKNFVENN